MVNAKQQEKYEWYPMAYSSIIGLLFSVAVHFLPLLLSAHFLMQFLAFVQVHKKSVLLCVKKFFTTNSNIIS